MSPPREDRMRKALERIVADAADDSGRGIRWAAGIARAALVEDDTDG